MSRRRFFVDEVRNGQARISGERALHLTRVLRIEPGQRFEVSDNCRLYLAEVELARKQEVVFHILEPLPLPEQTVRLHLLAALTKFDHFEWMLEKATELGVDTIVPVNTERSEKGLARAAVKRAERWNRILLEASQQSRRASIPRIEEPRGLKEAMGHEADARFVLLESGGAPPILKALPEQQLVSDTVAVLTGPEGGWTDEEVESFQTSGWRGVSLGSRILRAETAALAALAILGAAWAA